MKPFQLHLYDSHIQRMDTADSMSKSELQMKLKKVFTSTFEVGSAPWRLDVRRFMADKSSSTFQLIPASQHFKLQTERVLFITFKNWQNVEERDLSQTFSSNGHINYFL